MTALVPMTIEQPPPSTRVAATGRRKCDARSKRTGKLCGAWATGTNGKCKWHGGNTPKGPASAHYRTGMWAALPERLREAAIAAHTDPEMLSMRGDLALLEARRIELLQKLDEGESIQAWRMVRRFVKMAKDYGRARRWVEAFEAMAQLDAFLSCNPDAAVWEELGILMDRRARYSQAERQRMIDLKTMVTAGDVQTILDKIGVGIVENVKDPTAVRKLLEIIEALRNAEGNRVVGGIPMPTHRDAVGA